MKVSDKILLKDSVINVVNARIMDDMGLIWTYLGCLLRTLQQEHSLLARVYAPRPSRSLSKFTCGSG